MGIRIHHVNIRTRDLERTVAFYTGAIGLKQGSGLASAFPAPGSMTTSSRRSI